MEVEDGYGERRTGAVGVHTERSAVDGHKVGAKGRTSDGLRKQGGSQTDGSGGAGVSARDTAVQDGRTRPSERQGRRTGGHAIDCESFAIGHVNCSHTGGVQNPVGGDAVGHKQLAGCKGNGARSGVQIDPRSSQLSVIGNGQHARVQRGGAEVGVVPGQEEGAETGLGEARYWRHVDGRTADRAGKRKTLALPHIHCAGRQQADRIGERRGGVPVTERAAGKHELGGRRQGSRAHRQHRARKQGGVAGVAVGRVGEPQVAGTGHGQPGCPAQHAAKRDHAGIAGHVKHAAARAAEGDASGEVQIRGPCKVGIGGKGTQPAGGEGDGIGEGACRGKDRQTGGIRLEGATPEGERARTQRAVVTDLQGDPAVEGGAAGEAVGRVEVDLTAVHVHQGRGARTHHRSDHQCACAQNGGVHRQRAAAAAQPVGAARADA